jgi:hypothetical protein
VPLAATPQAAVAVLAEAAEIAATKIVIAAAALLLGAGI